jgi:hypothetical protein
LFLSGKVRGSFKLEPALAWSNLMGSVLCVTRGGDGDIRAQKEAIRIANDKGEPLVFLYVADSSFLNKLAAPVVVDIKGILESMGCFLLYLACGRAAAEDCIAEPVVRHGVLHQVLPGVVSEFGATVIIIGRPTGDPICFGRAEMDRILTSMKE